MLKTILQLLIRLYRFSPKQTLLVLVGMLILGLAEGISMLTILPIISLTTTYSGPKSLALLGFMSNFGIHSLSLLNALLIFIVLISLAAYFQRRESLQAAKLQQQFNTYLTLGIYQALANTNWGYWLSKSKSDINHVLSSEIMTVSTACYCLFQLITSACLLLIYLIISFSTAPELTAIILIFGGGLFLVMHIFMRKSQHSSFAISQHSRDLFFGLSEHLNGIKEIKAYGIEQQQLEQLKQIRGKIETSFLSISNLQSKTSMIYKIAAGLLITLTFYFAIQVLHLTFTRLVFILLIFARTWPRISSLQNYFQLLLSSLPAFIRVRALEDELAHNQREVIDSTGELRQPLKIEFSKVTFCYPKNNTPILTELNFSLYPGEFVACSGASGVGKSTLVDLLLGLLSPSSGQILINQRPLASVRSSYQALISYVPQDVFLFNASIRENLVWAALAVTDDEIWATLKQVQLDDLVAKLPEKLNSLVGDRGISLSGGERQRLVLARALLRKPQILVLDEATSALDEENQRLIQESLLLLKGKLTIFVVAHRLVTLQGADKIINLTDGSFELVAHA